MRTQMQISKRCFPTPDLALRTNVAAEQARIAQFAAWQADAASRAVAELTPVWVSGSQMARVAALASLYVDIAGWRFDHALSAPHRLGVGVPLDVERFRTTIDAAGANYDRLGEIGRLREGATWDEQARAFIGGLATPAWRVMAEFGRAAAARFVAEDETGDELVKPVYLSSAVVDGNRIVRGDAAAQVAARLILRSTARGRSTAQFDIGGPDLMYVVTAPDKSRAMIRTDAFVRLATATRGDVDAWREAVYLLYQAPMFKKGSDATTRVFAVAVGALLLDEPPVMPHDIDLRCMVLRQGEVLSGWSA